MAKKILVVDDDRNIGRILFAALQAKGYHAILAQNGQEAMEKFEVEQPDLVLLDVLLPRISGLEVCQQMKASELGKNTPVILISAIYKSYKMQADARKKYGADDFIEKPFQITKLLEKIGQLVGKPEEEFGVAATGAPGQISLEGSLEARPFAFLVHDLYIAKETGIAHLQGEKGKKEISFREGYPIKVKSGLEEEFLGNFLVRKRRITLEQRNQALIKSQSEAKMIGAALIELGTLSAEELNHYLQMQLREKLLEIFSWTGGQYQFMRDPQVTGDISELGMSPANLIYRGVMSRMPIELLNEQVDNWRALYAVPTSDQLHRFQELELTPEETSLVSMIDGSLRTEEVLARTDLDLDRSYRLIYALTATGMLELKEQPQATRPLEELQAAEKREIPEEEHVKREPEEEISKKVYDYFNRVQNANALQVLDLPAKPSLDEVKQAYFKLAKEFHPDRYHDKPEIVKLKAQEVFRRVQEAYEKLETKDKLKQYLTLLESQPAQACEVSAEVSSLQEEKRKETMKRVIEAESHFTEAEKYLKTQDWLNAAIELRRALLIQTDEPEYMIYFGWAIFKMADTVAEGKLQLPEELAIAKDADLIFVAREYLNRAIEANPRLDRGYLYLGQIYKRQGLRDMARRQFEKAAICNPSNAEAQRELMLMKVELRKAREKKGLKDTLKDILKGKLPF